MLKEDQELTDVVLLLSDKSTIHCHKLVLCAASAYFKAIFTKAETKEIKADFADERTMRAIIQYFYSGQIEITNSNLHDLLAVSQILQLEELKVLLGRFMVDEVDVSNAVEFFRIARSFDMAREEAHCMEFLLGHFVEAVSGSQSFEKLTESDLMKLFSDDRLNVEYEDFVYYSLLRWAQHSIDSRSQEFELVAQSVRFPFCTQKCLRNAAKEPLMMGPTCAGLIHEALFFKTSPVESNPEFNPRFIPRPSHKGLKPHLGRVYVGSTSQGKCFIEGQFTADIGSDDPDWKPLFKSDEVTTADIDVHVYLTPQEVHWAQKGKNKNHYWSALNEKMVCSKWVTPTRSDFTLHYDEHKLFAFGGNDEGKHCNTVESFNEDTEQWQSEAPMPEAVSKAIVVRFGSKVYLFGGIGANGPTTHCIEFDPIWNRYKKKSEMPEACEGGAAVAFVDGILVVGGAGRCCLKYLPEDDVWVKHSRPSKVHIESSAFSWKKNILLCSQKEAEQYDPEKDEWTPCRGALARRNSDTHHRLLFFTILK